MTRFIFPCQGNASSFPVEPAALRRAEGILRGRFSRCRSHLLPSTGDASYDIAPNLVGRSMDPPVFTGNFCQIPLLSSFPVGALDRKQGGRHLPGLLPVERAPYKGQSLPMHFPSSAGEMRQGLLPVCLSALREGWRRVRKVSSPFRRPGPGAVRRWVDRV